MTLSGLTLSPLTKPSNIVRAGECALSTGAELWWIGPIADLPLRRCEFPKADTLTLNAGDVEAVRAIFERNAA